MKEDILYITTKDDPEIKIRIAKYPSKDDKYSSRMMILIPGWLSGIDTYSPLAEALMQYGNVIIYEPRGFGKSITPHKKGLFSPEEFRKELACVLKKLNVVEKKFIIFGGSSGGYQAMDYYVHGEGPKPYALALISPQDEVPLPFFLPIFGWIPSFIMEFIQRVIVFFYYLVLKLKRKGETQNVSWAAERLKVNDGWCMRRFILEFNAEYDIKNKLKELDVPLIMFVGAEDYFVDPEAAKRFMHNPDSEIITLKIVQHRIHEGNEEELAKKTNKFLEKLSRKSE